MTVVNEIKKTKAFHKLFKEPMTQNKDYKSRRY